MVAERTQIVFGPESEVVRCLSSRRLMLGLMRDPVVHFYRASFGNTMRTTQAQTLCGRPVAWGKYTIRAEAPECPVCKWKLNWQSRRGVVLHHGQL